MLLSILQCRTVLTKSMFDRISYIDIIVIYRELTSKGNDMQGWPVSIESLEILSVL